MAVLSDRAARRQLRFGRVGPKLVLLAALVFFVAPMLAMARFALQSIPVIQLGWHNLFKRWTWSTLTEAFHDPNFGPTLTLSLKLAALTVLATLVLLIPTALFVHLQLPKARSLVEFLTVLPYVVPPIAVVAGVSAFFRPNAKWFLNSNYCLVPLYMVLALPFTYRSIDAGIRSIDVRTLVDASRNLGANWPVTLWRALLPNLRSAIISSSFLTATVVLGEFTIANTLVKKTFPTFTFEYYNNSARGGISLALLTLVFSTALLGFFTLLTRSKASRVGGSVIIHQAESQES